MKKILGISLVAVLAISPMIASAAAPTDHVAADYAISSDESGQLATNNTDTPEAEQGKYFKGKAVSAADATKVATGAYVKGAYNATISAINKAVDDLEKGIVNTVKSSYVENVVTDAALTSSGVDALTAWGTDDTVSLGSAELSVTRQNVAVKVLDTGTAQNPVEYHQEAASLASVVPGATETKVTPGSAGWQTAAQTTCLATSGNIWKDAGDGTAKCWNSTSCQGTINGRDYTWANGDCTSVAHTE